MATVRAPRTDRTDHAETSRPEPPEDRRRHLRVVTAGEKLRSPIRLTPRAGIVVTVLLFVALFAVAVSHALLIEGQARLDRIEEQAAEEQERYQRLQAELAELNSPERVLEEAEQLGMVEPTDRDWLAQTQSVPAGEGESEGDDAPATSYPEVKPYMESTTP